MGTRRRTHAQMHHRRHAVLRAEWFKRWRGWSTLVWLTPTLVALALSRSRYISLHIALNLRQDLQQYVCPPQRSKPTHPTPPARRCRRSTSSGGLDRERRLCSRGTDLGAGGLSSARRRCFRARRTRRCRAQPQRRRRRSATRGTCKNGV